MLTELLLILLKNVLGISLYSTIPRAIAFQDSQRRNLLDQEVSPLGILSTNGFECGGIVTVWKFVIRST
jgi:hypothetical protein